MSINKSNAGRRVELIYTDDLFTLLKPGDRGTYEWCMMITWPEKGQLQHSIKWDNGSNLMLLEGVDKFKWLT